MGPAETIVFTLYIQVKFIIRTNLVGPGEFELSGLRCINGRDLLLELSSFVNANVLCYR